MIGRHRRSHRTDRGHGTEHVRMRTEQGRLAAQAAHVLVSTTGDDAVERPDGVVLTGTGKVVADEQDSGFFARGSGIRKPYWWALLVDCTVVDDAAGALLVEAVRVGEGTLLLQAVGMAEGWSGDTRGFGGRGTLGPLTLSHVRWRSDGPVLAMTGRHDGGGRGTFEAAIVIAPAAGERASSPDGPMFEVWAMEAEFLV